MTLKRTYFSMRRKVIFCSDWISVYTFRISTERLATACVSALSQTLLDHGSRCCFLLTDVTNPTSNHIYREIGYRSISDWHEYLLILNDLEKKRMKPITTLNQLHCKGNISLLQSI
jgi:hypothetical protein